MSDIEAMAEVNLLKRLVDTVGPTLTAITLKAEKVESIENWTASKPIDAMSRLRLDVALESLSAITKSESEDVARAWFIGANVGEDQMSPCEALRDDRFDEVRISAQRLIDDEWS